MTWLDVQRVFVALRKDLKRTQAAVAERGGIAQGMVSKFESYDRPGPQVDTLLSAISGLGLLPSQFFARVESDEFRHKNTAQPNHHPELARMVESAPTTTTGERLDVAQTRQLDAIGAQLDAMRADIQTALDIAKQALEAAGTHREAGTRLSARSGRSGKPRR